MPHMLKIPDNVYTRFDALRVGRQTDGDLISELLEVRDAVLAMMDQAEVPAKFREWQRARMIASGK